MSYSSSENESDYESDIFSSDEEDDFSDSDVSDFREYDPEGVESDEDKDGCCHWTTTSSNNLNSIKPSPNLSEFGKPNLVYDSNIQPHELVEKILDDDLMNKCIECTNEHGKNDSV